MKENQKPNYPTLEEVETYAKKHSVTKAVALAALIAAVSISTACGGDKEETTEVVIDGDMSIETVLDGETETHIETTPTTTEEETYVLMGEETCETNLTTLETTKVSTKGTPVVDIMGGLTVQIEPENN